VRALVRGRGRGRWELGSQGSWGGAVGGDESEVLQELITKAHSTRRLLNSSRRPSMSQVSVSAN
jgi:hypothetical protein